jgi:2,3-bisphosphoglycerate-independent phosphoglycerate mutase
MDHQQFLARLAHTNDSRLVLLVIDGVGDLRTLQQPRTALEAAHLPHLDALAQRSALGRVVPVATGVTPGSGPGHLSLFGYDPTTPAADIGRGVLEALGLGLEVKPGQVAVRCNFATADREGRLTDRRAGRIPTSECQRLCTKLRNNLEDFSDLNVQIHAAEEHRFVLILSGEGLSHEIADTDPQETEVPPLVPRASTPEAEPSAARVAKLIDSMERVIADEPQANRVLLRGFSVLPDLPSLTDLHGIRGGAFAGYPLYRGVAASCGMEVVPCGKEFTEILTEVERHWDRFDYFFLHVKQTDKAGEDGDLDKKIQVLEQVDAQMPRLLDLGPTVVAITGDHSTPAPMAAHSWHPVPLLINGPNCFVDSCQEYTETAAVAGHLGTLPSRELMGLMLANAGRLAKFGA